MNTFCRVPARLGLGGGGTDIEDYFAKYGGAVLNCTINQYVYCNISPIQSGIQCHSVDKKILENLKTKNRSLILHWETINYFYESFNIKIDGIKIVTYTEIPEGSGLGTSSAMVVAMVKALSHHYNLPLDKSDLVNVAFDIERNRCALSGGFQDYISSVFGGFNFTEFFGKDDYLVNPLRISTNNIAKFENQSVLIFSGLSRSSSQIITDQQKSISDHERLSHMHSVKHNAYLLKKSLITSHFSAFRAQFDAAWIAKKATSDSVSNQEIDEIETRLRNNGAEAIKISGAGGGGFILALAPEEKMLSLKDFVKGRYHHLNVSITLQGAQVWTT